MQARVSRTTRKVRSLLRRKSPYFCVVPGCSWTEIDKACDIQRRQTGWASPQATYLYFFLCIKYLHTHIQHTSTSTYVAATVKIYPIANTKNDVVSWKQNKEQLNEGDLIAASNNSGGSSVVKRHYLVVLIIQQQQQAAQRCTQSAKKTASTRQRQ